MPKKKCENPSCSRPLLLKTAKFTILLDNKPTEVCFKCYCDYINKYWKSD